MSTETKNVCFRYYLKNGDPIDLLDFTKSLEAIQDEYTHFLEKRGAGRVRTRLNIHKVERGSIICDIIEAVPTVISALGSVNTLFEFGGYIKSLTQGLLSGGDIPSEANNNRSLSNISAIVAPLARTPNSELTFKTIDLGTGNHYENCTISINTTEGNALQNISNAKKADLEGELIKTEEAKERVLLRIVQINKGQETRQDRGIIEAFGGFKKKLIFESDAVKCAITGGAENFFKFLYLVDVVAMFNQGRLVAYRVTRVHDKIDPDEE